MNIAMVGSECSGMYWDSGAEAWVPVKGKVTKGSSADITQGMAIAHINGEVVYQTPDGAKKMKISSSCDTFVTENGLAATITCKVIGTNLRDGRIVGGCSQKVLVT